jgi:hypothetical protein
MNRDSLISDESFYGYQERTFNKPQNSNFEKPRNQTELVKSGKEPVKAKDILKQGLRFGKFNNNINSLRSSLQSKQGIQSMLNLKSKLGAGRDTYGLTGKVADNYSINDRNDSEPAE